mgnify:CR=1 FL=1
MVVIGFDVGDALFPGESAVGKMIRIRGQNFQVVGVAARQGSFLGLFSWDSMCVLPLTTYRRYFRTNEDTEVRVQVDTTRMADARDELDANDWNEPDDRDDDAAIEEELAALKATAAGNA